MSEIEVIKSSGYYSEVVRIPGTHAKLLRRRDSKNWYCELFIPGVETPRPRSTGKSDLNAALAVAREWNREAVIKVHREEPLTEPLIKNLLEPFMEWQRERSDLHDRLRRHRGISVNHIIPFFGARCLSSLTEKDSERFKAKRLKDGAKLSTVAVDLATLRDWAKFAMDRGYRKDRLRAPVEQQKPDAYDNSWFDLESYVAMRRALRYDDAELFNLVMFCYFTGCRVVEARNFCFEDVIPFKPRGGAPTIRIRLHGKAKSRVIPVLPVVKTIVDRMAVHHKRKAGSVFVNLKRLSERFHDFLVKEGLYEDAEGNHRELGSLRHTRATFELQRYNVPPHVLSAWMGHSMREQERTYSKVIKMLNQEGMHVRRPRRALRTA